MAWKPWYERAAEIENAQEREEFIKGALYGRATNPTRLATSAISGFLVGWGVSTALKKYL